MTEITMGPRIRETNPELIRLFIMGGFSEFTVTSLKSHKWVSFRVVKSKNWAHMYHVQSLSGRGKYLYLTSIFNLEVKRYPTKVPSMPAGSTYEVFFKWLFRKIVIEKILPHNVLFDRSTRCCRCGGKLTNPKSIAHGMGKKCQFKVKG